MIKHTIFTPVYNRADLINDVYNSIINLNYSTDEFEWIIVDDGSTDNIEKVIRQFDSSKVNVRYFYKQNGGIHTAHNFAIQQARGEYITRIDSDDEILPNALLEKDNYIRVISQRNESFAGVVGLCLNKSDNTVRGTYFPNEIIFSTGIELRKTYNVFGDRNYCIKTSILRKYPIPEHSDTKWVSEGPTLWIAIDREYLTCFVNIPFAICAEPNINSMMGKMKTKDMDAYMSKYYGSLYEINNCIDVISAKEVLMNLMRLLSYGIASKRRNIITVLSELKYAKLWATFLYLPSIFYRIIKGI
ncbi:MAG: glycosyltransferase family A protein [Muribaculaceae bacterium]